MCLRVARWDELGTPTMLQMWSCEMLVAEKFPVSFTPPNSFTNNICACHRLLCSAVEVVTRHKVTVQNKYWSLQDRANELRVWPFRHVFVMAWMTTVRREISQSWLSCLSIFTSLWVFHASAD